jgi:hypothetical protein
MKTNFKKLALMAGVSAAMAGGSMSAHAVIQAVPAPAALIPLFNGCVNNSNNSQINGGLTNYVRIETPSSVGVDSIVNLFGGPNGNASTGAIPASGVATGLATSTPSNSTVATSRLHWYFMSPNSDEIINSAFPVSANDVIEFTNCAMPTTQISSAGSMTTVAVGSQSSGYLVIINDSAALGGAPLFSFQADSYRVNTAGLNSSTVYENIPVYPLTDTADNGAGAPTLANNVIEDVSGIAGGAPFGTGPVVSPLMSGIRLGATNASGAPYGWYRVIDFPVINGNDTYVVWADRNATTNVVNGTIQTTPAIYGTTLTYDCNENVLSTGPLSFVDQLNFLTVGTTNSTAQTSTVANFDAYSNLFQPIGATTAQSTGCNIAVSGIPTALTGTNTSSGFVRYFAQSNPYTGDLTGAAYQASVIFRLRNSASEATYQFPVDRGFFTAK